MLENFNKGILMIPESLLRIIGIIVFCIGGIATVLGLLSLIEWCVWHIRERCRTYKRLHAYIKAHKVEFIEWNKKYNKEQK